MPFARQAILCRSLPLLIALTLFLSACSQQASVSECLLRPGSGSPKVMPMSARPLWTACLHDAGGYVPADYGEFTRMPSYPRTFKVWKDEQRLRARGARRVEIDLAHQRGRFLVNKRVAMDFPVCTGTKDKPTPVGSFRITQKDVDHVSNIYDVPMPFFMRLTDYGIGMHVGDVFRSPASHGCIRLTRDACVSLYVHAPPGTRVIICRNGWASTPEAAAGDSQGTQLARAEG